MGSVTTAVLIALVSIPGWSQGITVAAAADLNAPLSEMAANYQKQTGMILKLSVGSLDARVFTSRRRTSRDGYLARPGSQKNRHCESTACALRRCRCGGIAALRDIREGGGSSGAG